MVMERCLLLMMRKLGPRRQIRLPCAMLNCVLIIAFLAFRFVVTSCFLLPDKVFEDYTRSSDLSSCGKEEEIHTLWRVHPVNRPFGLLPQLGLFATNSNSSHIKIRSYSYRVLSTVQVYFS
jgi:hypothetical protein